MFRGKIQRIHFVGIGGSGMSGIAEVLLTMGYAVTGSDMRDSATVSRLRALGGTIFLGHSAEQVTGSDVVVKSTAVPNSNVEISSAIEQNIPVIPRAEMLAELMRVKYGIAVAGTHGKTTTTSMIATCLHHAKLDPTVVIGGRLNSIGSSAREGKGEFMVAEADESDGSFMLLAPTVAVVTNIDPEHMSHWGTEKALVDGFFDFASKVPFFGFAALCIDHPTVRTLVPWMRRRVVTYGLAEDAQVRGVPLQTTGIRTRFAVDVGGERLGEIELAMPGRHNIANATAAVAVALELDVDFKTIQEALHGFTGVDRRFSVRAEIGTPAVTLIDDYGHHPVEIKATLEGAREAFPDSRIIAVFQPHRFSRVADHFTEFSDSFSFADVVVVLPIYAAGEKPIHRIHHHRLMSRIQERSCPAAQAAESLEEAVEQLTDLARPGDVIITLGAGTVTQIHAALAPRLQRSHAP
ncbi:MAG: UDP-N-acetylmuramate--alanine ligase [Myxococcota bacterium]|jgi:UDP-N-acetylmuramate--alanine ligase